MSRVHSTIDMAPNSSDCDTKDGYSSETNDGYSSGTKDGSSSDMKDGSSSEPLVYSTGIASSFPEEINVETLDLEDSSESEDDEESTDEEEIEDEEEEVEEDQQENSEPEWDKDSFEGVEYHSPISDEEDDELEIDEESKKTIRRYHRNVIESKGFYEPPNDGRPLIIWSGIGPLSDLEQNGGGNGPSCREFLAKLVSQCLERYNKDKETNVKFEHILRANFNPGGRTKFYITFAAREFDSPDEPLVEYQAKALWRLGTEKTYPILCRPSPSPTKSG